MIHKLKHIIKEDNFLSLAGNVTVAVFGLAGFAILARSLPIAVFGNWVLFITASSFVEMFRFGLTNTGLIRYLSGSNHTYNRQLIGANAAIGLVSTLLIAVVLYCIGIAFPSAIEHAGYQLFFTWYPLVAVANLPWNTALVLLHAEQRFAQMLVIRMVNSVCFMLVLFLHLAQPLSISDITIGYLLANTITSLVCIFNKWDQLKAIKHVSYTACKDLLQFGKYTTFTLIGTNLLRSVDTFIISLSPLGQTAVALYSIPLKLTELQQIPLRSFTATAFPKLSKASTNNQPAEWNAVFNTYTGAITLLFIPLSLAAFLFAEPLVAVLGGRNYLQPDVATGANPADIMRIFAIYGLLLPLDRMTGIGLDSINQPRINAIKVFIMVIANVVGNLVAIYLFQSLLLVAVASVLFTIIGILVGMHFLRQHIPISYHAIFTSGYHFYSAYLKKIYPAHQSITKP